MMDQEVTILMNDLAADYDRLPRNPGREAKRESFKSKKSPARYAVDPVTGQLLVPRPKRSRPNS